MYQTGRTSTDDFLISKQSCLDRWLVGAYPINRITHVAGVTTMSILLTGLSMTSAAWVVKSEEVITDSSLARVTGISVVR